VRYALVLAIFAALTSAASASAASVQPDRGDADVLAGVTVKIPPGVVPWHSPNWVAAKVIRFRNVADASLTSLTYCTAYSSAFCLEAPRATLSPVGVWVAHFAGWIPCCEFGPPGHTPYYTTSAYYLVADMRLQVFGFGVP
jgi:hypothetical protein